MEGAYEMTSEVPEISPTDLYRLIDKGATLQLIDVREPDEWAESRIDGAVLIPQGEFFDGGAFAKLKKDIPIVLYCRSGRRSAACLSVMAEKGITDAVHLQGGILAWNTMQPGTNDQSL